jgi:hypothetical protein
MNNSAILEITAGGSFLIQTDADIGRSGGSPVFNNFGTLTKNSVGFDTDINVVFNNSGTVNGNLGQIQIQGGGTSSAGRYDATSGTVEFTVGSYSWGEDTLIGGSGTIKINGAPVTSDGSPGLIRNMGYKRTGNMGNTLRA